VLLPSASLGINLDPVIYWATWLWDQIDVAVYLSIGTVFAFFIAKRLISLFGH
jgi:hypothetical protein